MNMKTNLCVLYLVYVVNNKSDLPILASYIVLVSSAFLDFGEIRIKLLDLERQRISSIFFLIF